MEQAPGPPAVELRGISKVFGSNRALDDVDLRIGSGEVVGLLGQNGSGKSTLVKIMSGVYDPEPGGRMVVGGEDVPLPLPPGQASEIGLSFVYQNLALAAGLTVLENLTLGQRITATAAGSRSTGCPSTGPPAAVLDRYQVQLDLDQKTGELAPVDQARLAIVRAAEDLRRYRARTGGSHSVLDPRRAHRLPARRGDRPALRPDQDRRRRGRGGAVHLARPGRGAGDHRPGGRAAGRPGGGRGGHRQHRRGGAGRPHRRRLGVGPAGRGRHVERRRPGGRRARGRGDPRGDAVRRRRARPGRERDGRARRRRAAARRVVRDRRRGDPRRGRPHRLRGRGAAVPAVRRAPVHQRLARPGRRAAEPRPGHPAAQRARAHRPGPRRPRGAGPEPGADPVGEHHHARRGRALP